MPPSFLRIAPYCLLLILQDWLSVPGCVHLNTSCCNRDDREKLVYVLTISRKVESFPNTEQTNYFISLLIDCPFRRASTNLKCIKLRQLISEIDLHYVIDYLTTTFSICKRLKGTTCIDLEASLSQILSPTTCYPNKKTLRVFFTFWVRNDIQYNSRSHILYRKRLSSAPTVYSLSIFNKVSNGHGIHFYGDVEYCGNFLNGKRHGIGLLMYKNKTKYEGSFENDQYSGQGKLDLNYYIFEENESLFYFLMMYPHRYMYHIQQSYKW
jgi:hypothetical protein